MPQPLVSVQQTAVFGIAISKPLCSDIITSDNAALPRRQVKVEQISPAMLQQIDCNDNILFDLYHIEMADFLLTYNPEFVPCMVIQDQRSSAQFILNDIGRGFVGFTAWEDFDQVIHRFAETINFINEVVLFEVRYCVEKFGCRIDLSSCKAEANLIEKINDLGYKRVEDRCYSLESAEVTLKLLGRPLRVEGYSRDREKLGASFVTLKEIVSTNT